MRLRITKPMPSRLEGFNVSRFELDRIYEIHAPLCDVIIASGYGMPEDEPPVDRTGVLKALAGAITIGAPPKADDLAPTIKPDITVTPSYPELRKPKPRHR